MVGFNAEKLDKPKTAYWPMGTSLFDATQRFDADVRSGKPVRAKRDAK